MEFKFRDKVRVKAETSVIVRPGTVASQTAFFAGSIGTVIRHDPAKGGYLIVLDCPELSALMGETITAYFNEHELETFPEVAYPIPDAAKSGPFEYGHFEPRGEGNQGEQNVSLRGYQQIKAKANRAKRLGDA